MDDAETRSLLLHIWCHGQSVAPPVLAILNLVAGDTLLPVSLFILLLLAVWPIVSYQAMQRPSESSFARICLGGLLVESVYIYILTSTPVNQGGLSLVVFIFAALLAVETIAYLIVMWWNRTWFLRHVPPDVFAEHDVVSFGAIT